MFLSAAARFSLIRLSNKKLLPSQQVQLLSNDNTVSRPLFTSVSASFAYRRAPRRALDFKGTACDLKKQSEPFVEELLTGDMSVSKRLGFIGSGQMAESLARGLIEKGMVTGSQISCSDPSPARKDLFKTFGASPYESNVDVASNSDVIFVAVKPQHVAVVLQEIRPVLKSTHTIISIAAGITLETLLSAAGSDAKVVRVMPNTPCLVGETAAAMCLGGKADVEDEKLVRLLFEAVGKIFTVDEKLLSAVTGLSGSGPAYVFMMIEALADGGVRAGLPRDISQALAAQTVLGSAKMVLETGKHPGALKDMVTSPGGTTIAGVHELEKGGIRASFINAVVAATNRADELSKL
ncbi:hypothetical protein CEUSTIGMA_g6498.t1 [Chlamydomonas eustigma]|uniref:Pyrroline-5-carboxylate reductase n=1 Tax=Chlamydomonas eustigma TaxID=1157962 RepID=A0A250X7K1_9CHLO|nr:hypothetical protein CEUSTIGMA_g6498.t1 [Chlamydomonas eustigma]|eukprot:GAX79058.1 hypothetical protein CEUSTIGMA_g6498.t1 [Chlamydomonas eustigma]